MILYIIRHAWAGSPGDPAYANDFDRPLTPEGRKRFAKVIKHLLDADFAPTLIASSPLVRCRETAQIAAEGVPVRAKVVLREELAPGASLGLMIRWTAEQTGHEQIAWVGHMPDVSMMAAALIGTPNAAVDFAKGAVAAIRFDGPVALGQGELRWLATAKLLGIEK